jgi:hypothetical protein
MFEHESRLSLQKSQDAHVSSYDLHTIYGNLMNGNLLELYSEAGS